MFPQTRLRRLRRTPGLRDLHAEHALTPADLIQPLFVTDVPEAAVDIPGLPEQRRHLPEALVRRAADAYALGIRAIALFPYIDPRLKDETGREGLNPDNLICRTLRLLKAEVPDLLLIADAALDPYTVHGHDGPLRADRTGTDNDATAAALAVQAVHAAAAGADIVAPSDMSDGRIGIIRRALEAAGHTDTVLVSYTAKYASAFYGPFRNAAGSASLLIGDKRTYQMDPRNAREALREAELDAAEGADVLMVKPGLLYLDIVARLKPLRLPIWAYQVSGEYAMLHAGAAAGAFNLDAALYETLIAFKRAGCSAVLTYGAMRVAAALGALTPLGVG